jgi:hypothetical protein
MGVGPLKGILVGGAIKKWLKILPNNKCDF